MEAIKTRLAIDLSGMLWAHGLGVRMRNATWRLPGIRADRICPFSEGSPHRRYWYDGWRGRGFRLDDEES